MIEEDIIERVNNETDILQLIGSTVELKKNGAVYKGLCPFHNEKSPSFTVTPEKGIFFCFGCGETGDSIKWLQKHEGMNFRQAAADLAGRIGIHIAEDSPLMLRPPKSSTPKPRVSNADNRVSVNTEELADVSKDAIERLDFEIPVGLKNMMRRKGWTSKTIKSLVETKDLGVSSDGVLYYIYPNGIKMRTDYGSSRGDRWLMGGAKGNLWRGRQLEHELVEDVFVTEGESDLITLVEHRPEGIRDAYIAVAGSQAKFDPVMAHTVGSDTRLIGIRSVAN